MDIGSFEARPFVPEKRRKQLDHEVGIGESKKRIVPKDASHGETLKTISRLTCDTVAAFAERSDGTRVIVLTHVKPEISGYQDHKKLLERDLPRGELIEKKAVLVTVGDENNPVRRTISTYLKNWLGGKDPKVIRTSGMLQDGVEMSQEVIIRVEPSDKGGSKGFVGVVGTSNWEDL